MTYFNTHHRRPTHVGVIAGQLWSAHDRRGTRPMTSAPHPN